MRVTGLSSDELAQFERDGFLRLGRLVDDEGLAALQGRIDDIMLGNVPYPHMRLQRFDADTGELRRTNGCEVPTLSYRRIDDLEQDPLFLAYLQHPRVEAIARQLVGDHVSVFRSMFMNKPARWEQTLPWHQDVGTGWKIDRNPIMTVWTALDAASTENGCMQVVPGSHREGVLNERHFLRDDEIERHAPADRVVDLEAEAGEAILLHNLLLHRSGTNPTDGARRAFSATYMEADTKTLDTGQTFPVLFGEGALHPDTVGDKPAELIQTFYG